MSRLRCVECSSIIDETAVLVAPNPFDHSEELHGCPTCKSVDSLVSVCDEPGCDKDVSCGWVSPAGYRHTCYQHSNWVKR